MKFKEELINSQLGHAVFYAMDKMIDTDSPITFADNGEVDVFLKINNVEVDPFLFYKEVEEHMDAYINEQAKELIKEKADEIFDNLNSLNREINGMCEDFKASVKEKFSEKGFKLDEWE